MYDKNYFLNQLRNGVSMDSMGQALADAMNEAQDAYAAELAVKEKEAEAAAMAQTKRDMALDLIDIIRDYGDLVAPEAANMLDEVDDDDMGSTLRIYRGGKIESFLYRLYRHRFGGVDGGDAACGSAACFLLGYALSRMRKFRRRNFRADCKPHCPVGRRQVDDDRVFLRLDRRALV
jgi:hypothetical protein